MVQTMKNNKYIEVKLNLTERVMSDELIDNINL